MNMQKNSWICRIEVTALARMGGSIAPAMTGFSMPQLLFACRPAAIDVLAGPLASSRLNR